MLWKCKIKYEGKDHYVSELRYSAGSLSIDPAIEESTIISTFMYETTKSPALVESNGKKYLMPGWLEVHPETTIDDVFWNQPLPQQVKTEKIPVGEYVIQFNDKRQYYTCTCQGFWRVLNKQIGCKHVRAHKENLVSRITK